MSALERQVLFTGTKSSQQSRKDSPFFLALEEITPNATASRTNKVTNGNTIHMLNSIGLTGSAMLDGLFRRCVRALIDVVVGPCWSTCAISINLDRSAWFSFSTTTVPNSPSASVIVEQPVSLLANNTVHVVHCAAIKVCEIGKQPLIVRHKGHDACDGARIGA